MDTGNAGSAYLVETGGQQYGPVDLDGLKRWVAEGRLTPDTVLVDTASGARVTAGDLPGLFPPVASAPPPRVAGPYPPGAPAYAAPARRGFPVWAAVLLALGGAGFLLIVLLAAILFPIFSQARLAAKKTLGMSHLRMLATASLMYSNDYDGKLPPSFSTAESAKPFLRPYLPTARVPGSLTPPPTVDELCTSLNPSGGSILGNGRLAGRSIQALDAPASIVLLYDEKPWPDGKLLVAYADGHVKAEARGFFNHDFAIDPFSKP